MAQTNIRDVKKSYIYLNFSIVICFSKDVKNFYTWKLLNFFSPCFSYDSASFYIIGGTVYCHQKSKLVFNSIIVFEIKLFSNSSIKFIIIFDQIISNLIYNLTCRMVVLAQLKLLKNLPVE